MTLDEVAREALLHRPGHRPRRRAGVYARAVMRLVEVGRREGEDFYEAYLRARARPSTELAALVLIHREQFGRERRAVVQ